MEGESRDVETTAETLRRAMLRAVAPRTDASGAISLPCEPAMLDDYERMLLTIFELVGRPFSASEREALRQALERNLAKGAGSPAARLVVTYKTEPPPRACVVCRVAVAMPPRSRA